MNSSPSTESKSSIIDAVKNPLGFVVLGLLVVDGTLATLALNLTAFQPQLVWTIIISIPSFVLLVVGLAVWRPEALSGDRPLQKSNARQFATDLFLALDGALSNLEPAERVEAWLTVGDVIKSADQSDKHYSNFCLAIAGRLETLTNLRTSHAPIEQTTNRND